MRHRLFHARLLHNHLFHLQDLIFSDEIKELQQKVPAASDFVSLILHKFEILDRSSLTALLFAGKLRSSTK